MADDLDTVLDAIDHTEEDLDNRRSKIEAYERRAAQSEPGSQAWAELLLAASDHHLALEEHDVAIAQLEQIRAAGTFTEPSVEAHLLSAHLAAGHEEVTAELERLLRARSRERDLGDDYSWVGESYEEAGRLAQALRWYSMANRDIDPDDLDLLSWMPLAGRRRRRSPPRAQPRVPRLSLPKRRGPAPGSRYRPHRRSSAAMTAGQTSTS